MSLLLRTPQRYSPSFRGESKAVTSKDLQISALRALALYSINNLFSLLFLEQVRHTPPYDLCISCSLFLEQAFPRYLYSLLSCLFQLKRDHLIHNCPSSPRIAMPLTRFPPTPLYSIHPTYCIFIYLLVSRFPPSKL